MAVSKNGETPTATENAHDRFRRLARARVKKVLHDMRLVANLATPHYKYTPIEVDAIVTAIEGARETLEARFRKPSADVRDEFDLPVVEEAIAEEPETEKAKVAA